MSGPKRSKKKRTEKEVIARKEAIRIAIAERNKKREIASAKALLSAKRRYWVKYVPNYFFIVACFILILLLSNRDSFSAIKFFVVFLTIVVTLFFLLSNSCFRVKKFQCNDVEKYEDATFNIKILVYLEFIYTMLASSAVILFG